MTNVGEKMLLEVLKEMEVCLFLLDKFTGHE
jgi:hypothetical protein